METFWRAQAKSTARRINFARWLEPVVPATALLCLAGGCLLLIFRRNGWSLPALWWSVGALFAAIALAGWWRNRRNRFDPADGLVRLEIILGLHNRLSSAAAGVVPWPEPSPTVDDRLRWNWPRLLGPALAGIAFLIACGAIPITRAPAAGTAAMEEPPVWSEVEKALETLKENETAAPEALAAVERKLESLRAHPESQWYKQSSLEAGESLRNGLANDLAELGSHLSNALNALESTGNPAISAETAAAQWKEALAGLTHSPLPLNPAQLAGMPGTPVNLSAEEMNRLKAELAQNAQACEGSLQSLGESLAILEGTLVESNGPPQATPGGPGPGGGHVPLGFQSAPQKIDPQSPLPVSANDPERMSLGDSRGQSLGEHAPAETVAPAAGGGIHSVGQGGEAVWRNELPPGEQSILRQFFQ